MAIAFYVLLQTVAPVTAKIVFISVPLLIWVLGGIAIYREYHEQEKDRRKEEEILREAKKILNSLSRKSAGSEEERHD